MKTNLPSPMFGCAKLLTAVGCVSVIAAVVVVVAAADTADAGTASQMLLWWPVSASPLPCSSMTSSAAVRAAMTVGRYWGSPRLPEVS